MSGDAKPVILIVDDDPDLAMIMKMILSHAGFEAHSVLSGQEALNWLGTRTPDLILLDLMMPVMNGWQLAEALRKDSALAKIPVLIMTAGRLPTADQLPGYEIVRKPVELEQLLSLVRGYLTPVPAN